MRKKFRSHILSCVAIVAIAPVQAHAQTAEATGAASAAQRPDTEIVVTGTRIKQDGYDAPVPVNVLGAAEINAQRPANLADLVYTMPAVGPVSANAKSNSGNLSRGDAGINTINLRGLGSSRTLVLLNGRRVPPSSFFGDIDINTIPQELVQRVEVVTGGASAQYGSDAVGGVVNFILDEKFKGLKLGADTSVTTYGDAHNYRITGTAGLEFLDGRLRVLLNGSYFHQDGVGSIRRPWNNSGYQIINNPAYVDGNGEPQYFVGSGIGPANMTSGGLINSGLLRGTYFLGDGVTRQLNYGITNAVSTPWMIGGDWQITNERGVGTTSLIAREDRTGAFGRVAYDITPDVTLYGEFSWNRYHGKINGATDLLLYDVQADNGFLLTQYPQVAAAMQANGLSSIAVGKYSDFLYGTDNSRDVYRYLAGATGNLSLFSRPWSWDLYFQRGIAKTHEEAFGILNTSRFALARDAVLSNGQIVCRSTLTDPTNGCVPIDMLGTGGTSAASLDYVFGPEQPWREQTFKQDVISASASGELFDLPGGPVAVALGGEWRKDRANGKVGEATRAASPFRYANYKVNRGEITVKEAFVEASLPLFRGLDINAAGRLTDYSTSGSVKTWKVGATYAPIPDVKLRGAYSHDIRAPSMTELFLNNAQIRIGVLFPAESDTPGLFQLPIVRGGNPDLKPERANTLTAGIVVNPTFLPGFSASVDFWDIKIKDVISSVSYQTSIDFCYGGFPEYCNNIFFANGQPDHITEQPVNFARQHARGLDFEASYRTPLSAISSSLPGNFSIHASATHYVKNVVDNLVFPVDYAGVIGDNQTTSAAASPKWIYRVTAFYDADPFLLNLVARGFSGGVYSNTYIECTSSCPTSTVQNRTINDNNIKGAMYFDGSIGMKLRPGGHEATLSFIVQNIFNKDPVLVGYNRSGAYLAYPQTVRALYDDLGRVFRVSLTSKF